MVIPEEFQFLLAWDYENFFDPTGFEQIFACKGCGEKVMRWKRQEHYDSHKTHKTMLIEASRVAATLARETDTGDIRTDVCVSCGNVFQQERKRGRPKKKCYDCLPA